MLCHEKLLCEKKKNSSTSKWIPNMRVSLFFFFFNINMLLNLCLQHSFKEKEDFKGTPIGDTVWEIYSFNCSNNFAIAAPLFSLAVTVTPLICFQ